MQIGMQAHLWIGKPSGNGHQLNCHVSARSSRYIENGWLFGIWQCHCTFIEIIASMN